MATQTITSLPRAIFHEIQTSHATFGDLPYEIVVKIQELVARNMPRDWVMLSRVCKLTHQINTLKIEKEKIINDLIQEGRKIEETCKAIDQLVSSQYPQPWPQESDEMINRIVKAKDLDEAISIFKKFRWRADSQNYKALLKKKAPWPCIKKLFQSIRPTEELCIGIVQLFIRLAGRNGDFMAAKEAFESTKALNLTHDFTYACLIYAAGQVGDLKTATEIFNEVKSRGIENVFTYACLMSAAGKNGNLKMVTEIFNEGKSRNFWDRVFIYLQFVELALNNGDFETAKVIFDEAKTVNYTGIFDLSSITLGTTNLSEVLEKKMVW